MSKFSEKFQIDLETLEVPSDHRKSDRENASWFLSNGIEPNRDHPKILLAIYHALKLQEEEQKESSDQHLQENHINYSAHILL